MKIRDCGRNAVSAAVLAIMVSWLSAVVVAQPASPQAKAVIGYIFPRENQLLGSSIRGDLLTHINYAFANIKDGRIVAERRNDAENLRTLTSLRSRWPDLKILISVGGWTWSGGFSDMALSRASRKTFIDSAVGFIRKHSLDGIDIDWEYPGLPGIGNTNRPEDKENFTLLLRDLREALNAARKEVGRRYLLTIAAGAEPDFLAHTEMGKVQKSLDYVNVMAYDFFEEDGGKSGHHSNLYPSAFAPEAPSGSTSVSGFLRASVPAEKIVLGVPFYGRGWKGTPPENNGLYQQATGAKEGYSWNNLVRSYIGKNGYTRWWDVSAKAPYLRRAEEQRVITYDDPESMKEKCAFVKQRRLGGIMFWEYGGDDAEHTLLRTIFENLH